MPINIIVRDNRDDGTKRKSSFAKEVLGGCKKMEESGEISRSRYSKKQLRDAWESFEHDKDIS